MPVGTVRGRYELDAPALRTLRDLERQGIRTERQMRAIGTEMDKLVTKQKALGRSTRDLANTMSRETRRMETAWKRQAREFERSVDRQERSLTGLEARLDAFATKKVTAQVDVDGIAQALAQVELLESRLNSLGRSRSTPRVGMGGMTAAAASRAGGGSGGGGRSGGGIRSIGFGAFNLGSRSGLALIGAGLPAVRALGGATVALGGSLGMGAFGAGALGVAGGGALAAGIGSLVAVAKPAQKTITDASKAQVKYNMALADFGRNSTQARNAKRELDQAFAAAPRGTRDLLRDFQALRTEWSKATRPGQASWVHLLGSGTNALRRLTPTAAAAGNRSAAALDREGSRFANFIAGPTGRRFLDQGSRAFDENLGSVRRSGQYGIEAGVNVMEASRPFLRDATRFIERWTRGWATSTRDINRTRTRIGQMVDHLKSWARLMGATWRLLRDAGGGGASAGQGLVERLTGQLNTWDQWIKRNPAQVREFFRQTVNSTIDLAKAAGQVAKAVMQIAKQLTPVLDRFTQLVSLAGSLGLLTPGAGALALGAYRGVTGRGGRRGGGGGGGMALLPMGGFRNIGRGGITGAPRGYTRATYGLARSFGYGRIPSAAAAGGGLVLGGLGTGGGIARAGLRGAARGFAPVAAGLAVLDAATFQGSAAERAQAALSGATLGLVHMPQTGDQKLDQARQYAQRVVGWYPGGNTITSQRAGVRSLAAKVARTNAEQRDPRLAHDAIYDSHGGKLVDGAKAVREYVRMLNEELRTRRATLATYREQRREELNAKSVETGDRQFGERQTGFRRNLKRHGADAAGGAFVGGVLGDMKHLRTQGAKELAGLSLDWLNQQRKLHPELQNEYDKLVRNVLKRFRHLHNGITIVNGQIRTGTKSEWQAIRSEMATAARQGVDETSAEFARLRALAIGTLVAMGYSKSQARRVFSARQRFGPGATSPDSARGQGGRRADVAGPVGGVGPASNGPGGGPTPEDQRWRARQQQRATAAGGTGGNLMGANAGLSGYAGLGSRYGLHVSSGRRPGAITSSGNTSLHSSGDAIDESGSPERMLAYARTMAQRYGAGLDELIHTPLGFGIKNGRRVPLSYWGATVNADHYDHVHVGDRTPSGRAGALAAGAGGIGAVSLRARRSRLGGVPGMLSTAASAGVARGMEGAINAHLGGGGGRGGSFNAASLAALWRSAGGPAGVARLQGAIAMAESNGNARAHNPSGASGLWQILGLPFPGDPMDPYTNARMAVAKYRTQGLGAWEAYTNGSYQRYLGSFRRGGRFITRKGRGGVMEVGEGAQQEEVIVRPHRPGRKRPPGGGLGGGHHVAVSVDMRGSTIREAADVDRLAEKVGEKVGEKLLAALADTSDGDLL